MDKRHAAGEIQEALRNISLAFSYLPLIHPDGIFGSKTKEAVKTFQREHDLNETGEVDLITWQHLFKENKRALEELKEPSQIIPIRDKDLPLEFHDKSEFVKALQNMLNTALCRCDGFERLPCHGLFDENTCEAVRLWQKICRKEETGKADKETWNLLSEFYRMVFYLR